MSPKKYLAAFTTACLLISSPAALAVVVLQAAGVLVDMSMGSASGYPPSAMIDQTGLTGADRYVSGVTEYDSYVDPPSGPKPIHAAAISSGNSWRNDRNGALTGFIDYDLGGDFLVSNVALWSGSGNSDFGSLQGFDVWVDAVPAGTFVADNQFNPLEVQNFELNMPLVGTHVRFGVTSNYGAGVSIAEVAFGVSPVTPVTIGEPFTVALLGIGLAGFGIRKRPLA